MDTHPSPLRSAVATDQPKYSPICHRQGAPLLTNSGWILLNYPTWSCVQLTFQSTTLPISSVGIASPWFYKCEVHGLKKSSLSLFYLPSYFSLPPSPSLSLSLSLFSYLFSQNCSFNHSSFNTEHFNLKKSLKPHFTIFIPYRSFIDVLFWEGINKIWKKLA